MDIESVDDLKNLEGRIIVINEKYEEIPSYDVFIE